MNGISSLLLLATLAVASPEPKLAIPVSEFEKDLKFVSSKEIEGRMTRSAGLNKTGEFLVKELKKAGLKPGAGDSFFHSFEITFNQRPTKNNLLTITAEGKTQTLKVGKDYLPLVGSTANTKVSGRVLYMGYGREEDYKNVVATDRIVVVLRGAAEGNGENNNLKAARAAAKGAKAILFVGPSKDGRADVAPMIRINGVGRASIVGASVSQKFMKNLIGMDFQAARKDTSSTLLTDTEVTISTESESNTGPCRNVIAILPGNDPKLKDELIVLGAHYDHLGYGEVGSIDGTDGIHYGADDNGSGTIANLALARHFAKTKSNRRTLMFQWYSGEEVGLVGSTAWVRDNMKTSVPKIQAMFNMDMVGRLREEALTVYCVDSAPVWETMLDKIQVPGVKPSKIFSSPGNSDHAEFVRSKVPSLFFNTGLHPQYHRESDQFDTINLEGMAKVIDFVRQTVIYTDGLDQKLPFTAKTTGSTAGGSGDPSRPRRVRTGFMPDEAATGGRGLLLRGASPGSPAEKAGIKPGDRLLKLGDVEIGSLEDLQAALVKAKVGETLKAIILRDGKEIEVSVTPEAPAGG